MQFFSEFLNSTNQKNILVVDDSPVLCRAYACALEAWGYNVGIAEDGLVGLARLRSERYQLVITDYEMPRCNGLEFFKQAQLEIDGDGLPPFILITGTPLQELAGQLDGFVAAFAKPVGIGVLRDELGQYFGNS